MHFNRKILIYSWKAKTGLCMAPKLWYARIMPRPNVLKFQSPKVGRTTFLNNIKCVDQRILRLSDCEMFGRVVTARCRYTFFIGEEKKVQRQLSIFFCCQINFPPDRKFAETFSKRKRERRKKYFAKRPSTESSSGAQNVLPFSFSELLIVTDWKKWPADRKWRHIWSI